MKTLFSVALLSGALTLLRMASGFVIAKVVAVYTGPSGIAMLGQVQGIVTALAGVLTSPVGAGMVRFTSEHHAQGYEACGPWWRAAFRWLLLLALVLMPLTCLFAEQIAMWTLNDAGLSWVVVACALGLPLAACNTLIASVLNGQQRYRAYVAIGMLSVLVATLTMLWLVHAHGLKGALFSAAIFTSISGLVMLVCVFKAPWMRLVFWWGQVDPARMKDIGGYVLMAAVSAVTIPTALVEVRNTLIDAVGWEQAGLWQAVYRISEVYLALITVSFSTYYLPRLAQLKGHEAILSEVHRVARVVLPVSITLAMGVYLLRDEALQLLFDARFEAARDLFAVQLVGDIFKILTWLYAYPMLSSGAKYWFIASELLFALAIICLTKILVHLYGLDGANVAYSLSYAICFIFVIKNSRNFMR